MDTSETYIKMCDCPEIQEQWKVGIYDFAKKREWPYVFVQTTKIRNKVWYIWLPRQDQIQEMLRIRKPTDLCYRGKFGFPETKYFMENFTTFEQLWFAFYMYEKHDKVWDGEKWVKK